MTDKSTSLSIFDSETDCSDLRTLLSVVMGNEGALPQGHDVEAYLAILDENDATQEEKIAFIHIVWQLVESLLGIHFGLDPDTLELKSSPKKFAGPSKSVLKLTSTGPIRLEAKFREVSVADANALKGRAHDPIQ